MPHPSYRSPRIWLRTWGLSTPQPCSPGADGTRLRMRSSVPGRAATW
jgi:hypothetical protein